MHVPLLLLEFGEVQFWRKAEFYDAWMWLFHLVVRGEQAHSSLHDRQGQNFVKKQKGHSKYHAFHKTTLEVLNI